MLVKSFEWQGTIFEVRTVTALDTFLFYGLVYDVGKIVLAHYGFDIDKTDYPRSLDMLITQFVTWARVTKVTGSTLNQCDLLGGKSSDILGYYLAWKDTVIKSPELWALWDNIYKEATFTSEKKIVSEQTGATN